MKKIIYSVLENSLDDPSKYFFETYKNSLLIFDKELNNFLFKCKYRGEQQISIKFEFVSFDEMLSKKLIFIIDNAIIESKKINIEPIKIETTTKSEIIRIIKNAILVYDHKYEDISNKTIFDFVGKIFIGILRIHSLGNGNKRFILTYLIHILRYFGYHLN
jgi:prophage maintenance system killer protein